MRWLTVALFLLSSLGMIGCSVPPGVSAGESEPLDELHESLPPSGSDDSVLTPESEPEGLLSAPDPLAEEPVEPSNLKAKAKRPIWLFYYGYQGCGPCRACKPNVQSWASKKGLTQAEANAPNSRLTQVRYIDIQRDKVKRSLVLEGGQEWYPTLIWVDQYGNELGHYCGIINEIALESMWDALEKSR